MSQGPSGPRLVLLLHSSAGRYGADRQLHLIATGLDPERYRALVVLPEAGALSDELHADGVQTLIRPLAVLRRELMTGAGLGRVAAAWAADAGGLGRLARARGVALVHTNTSVTLGGAAAARIARIPHVWHVREIYAGFERWWPAYRRLLTSADALVCVSQATREQFTTVADPAIEVIYDGLSRAPQAAPSADARARARRSLGIGSEQRKDDRDRLVVSILGRLSGWKGQDVLLRALAEPTLRRAGVIGVIAGEPWRGQQRRGRELRALASTLGVAERVHFVGFRADVETVYAASDVVVVASTAPDPLPNAALEAAAAGRCVVASDAGGLPEIVHDTETGRLFAPGDPRALARVLAELAGDPAARERLGAAAAGDVRRRFAPARLLDRLQGLYDRLLSYA